MSAYDHWKQNDFEGERAQAEADARAERTQDAWDALGFRARADLIDHLAWQFRGQGGYSRKQWLRDRIAERLS